MHRNRVILLSILSAIVFSSCQRGIAFPTLTPLSTLSQSDTFSVTPAESTHVIIKEVPPFTPAFTGTSTLESIPSPSRTLTQVSTSTPTFAPQSFDVSKVITRTPSNPAICPQSNPDVKPEFGDLLSLTDPDLEKPILDYLNSGGTWETLLTTLDIKTSGK